MSQDRIGRVTRRAVRDAYQDIGSREPWYYLLKRAQLNTVAPYDTGTVAFTAATRTLTLSGGTWPSWAASGSLLINRNVYAAVIRVDGTHLILDPERMPVVDLPSGTGYQLVQTNYNLPPDFQQMKALIEIERLWQIVMLPPEEMLARTQLWYSPSEILFYTVLGGQNGRMQVQIAPPPATARTYDMIYQGRPRLRTLNEVYNTGTITTTAGSATVNFGGGASIPENCAGCVLRIGTASKLPDNEIGDNPYVEEHVVLEWVSSTQVILEDAAIYANTNCKFTLDDPIDLEPVSQMTLFDRMCETRMLRLQQVDLNYINAAAQAELMAYREALRADERLSSKVMQGLNGYMSLADGFWGVQAHDSVP